jgi:aspartate aminotransferase
MNMSQRISGFQASPIRRLVPYANQAKQRGVKVYHLNIGQPDIKTPVQVIEAIQGYDKNIIAYGQSEGEFEVRQGLQSYYRSFGVEIAVEDIMITTGGSEALQFAFMTLCDPGDEVIVPEPFYTNVASFARSAMVDLVAVTSTMENGFALPPIETFEERMNERTKAVLLCSPNNPTATFFPRKNSKRSCAWSISTTFS